MMARPQEQRRLWTSEEDNKLTQFKLKYPDRSWPDTAQLAGLDRTDKSCWERWNNHLKSGVNKENFSEEEDDIIIRIQRMPEHRNKWAFMAKDYLRGRTANAIKNRWNNHLEKMLMGDLERYLLTDDETSDHSAREDDVTSVVDKYASLI
ncbi:trichome differentiation protein GL1-like [Vitis riparia]|uniref:trichome differentiation protein GL1-like n=1 Tax=Vitis riparia TaxID=96939 RepID=UPI00155AA711|nr:trichome differentiation protein GL1-like [Vitis riparia]